MLLLVRRGARPLVAVALLCSGAASCGEPAGLEGAGGSGPSAGAGAPACGTAPTWNRDVAPIVAEHCMPCHAEPPFGSPLPLTRYAHTQAEAPASGAPVYEALAARVRSEEAPMPPHPHGRLSEEDQARIAAWAAAGAPERCDGDDAAPPSFEGASCSLPETWGPPDLEVRMPEYAFQDAENDWQCLTVTVPSTEKRHMIHAAPLLDPETASSVHHMVLFKDTTKSAPDGPFPCGTLTSAQWEILSIWAPGTCSYSVPENVGMPLERGDRLVLQMHYYGTQKPKRDSSGLGLWYAPELREHEAAVFPLADFKLAIPPGKKRYETDSTCLWVADGDKHVFGAFPHMHKMGRELYADVSRDGKHVADLVHEERWSFEHQEMTRVDPPVLLKAGDHMRLSCVYDSTGRSGFTFYGDGTDDEMCYAFLLYYPRGNPVWCAP